MKYELNFQNHPFHVVNRTNNQEWFKVPISKVFEIFSVWLNWSHLMYGAITHHFELMTNHYHWLLSTPNDNLGRVMNFVQMHVSREINEYSESINHVFGSTYKRTAITNVNHYLTNVKYLYRNSIRAGLCSAVQNYPYSTLGFYLGIYRTDIWCELHPYDQYEYLYDDSFVDWLNDPFKCEDEEVVKYALKKKTFKYRRMKKSQMLRLTENPWIAKT